MTTFTNPKFNTAIFYTCGTCNLQCRYCGIHKSPVLKDIDDKLAQSFEGDYYFNQVKKYFPLRHMLQRFETWGGEPFIHMERIHNLLRQLIEYYPFLRDGFSSTNFSYPQWNDKFFDLMKIFGEYPDRYFTYDLQLSVDGPPDINDAGRGSGVTQRCLDNFNLLVERLGNNELPKNVQLCIMIKGTLDNDTMKKLVSIEEIVRYYKFFEDNFYTPINKLTIPNLKMSCSIPNTAVPSPVTVEDGKLFALTCKLCKEIEKDPEKYGLKYYKNITPYSSDIIQDYLGYNYGEHHCSTGDTSIGFLPDGLLSTCHEGFTQIVEEYTKRAAQDNRDEKGTINFAKFFDTQKVSMSATPEQYANHFYKMQLYSGKDATARLASNTALIMALALAGQVESCYLDETNALKAAIFMQGHAAYCIKDNYNQTGSYIMMPVGLFKLLLNGAMQYIQNEGELRVVNGEDIC